MSWTDDRLDAYAADTASRFDRLERRIDARFDKVDERFDKMEARFEKVDARFERIDERFERIDERFEGIDKRFDSLHHMMLQFGFGGIVTMAIGLTGLILTHV